MSYYLAGDYYMAGGIFGSIGKFLGGVAKTAVGGVTGALTGGPLGAITGALGASGILKAPSPAQQVTGISGGIQLPTGIGISGGMQFQPVPQAPIPLLAAGSAGSLTLPPKGYHWNKSSYFLRDGTYVQAGTKAVKNRYTNPANGRALRRAIRRTKGFENIVKRNRKSLRALARI